MMLVFEIEKIIYSFILPHYFYICLMMNNSMVVICIRLRINLTGSGNLSVLNYIHNFFKEIKTGPSDVLH